MVTFSESEMGTLPRCACGHLKSHHDRMDGWKCMSMVPRVSKPPERCQCEGFKDPSETDQPKECPGQGQCHGSTAWCNTCGDVGVTCHTPLTCDTHRERFANKIVKQRKEEAEW